jgi:hypothetical protein
MKLIARVITGAACAAAVLVLAPAAASASYPPPDTTNQLLDRAQPIEIHVQSNNTAHDAVQMAVAIALGASVATAVRRRRQPDPDLGEGFLQRVPTQSDAIGDVLVKQ